jgi:hypothetical protein
MRHAPAAGGGASSTCLVAARAFLRNGLNIGGNRPGLKPRVVLLTRHYQGD